ncbi:MAG: hypothetical protein JXQ99_14635 [Hyphomicrobiaceae bacterium]
MQTQQRTCADVSFPAILVFCLAMIGGTFSPLFSMKSPAVAGKTKSVARSAQPIIGQGRSKLPVAVNEMRDAIIAAARSGRLDELLIPIQWNELPPDFGDLAIKETLADWKKRSADGSGREWLAKLIDLLDAPYAVLRKGPDIENNKIFVWPAFSEMSLKKLSPALHVELLRLAPAADVARMITQDRYEGHGLAIGADGTWHAFKNVKEAAQPTK